LKKLHAVLPERKNVRCSLFDAWHKKASRIPIPFPLLDARHIAVDFDGLDLGLVHLERFFRRQLQSNGIQAFIESTWRSPPTDMIRHAVIGFPEQFIDRRENAARVLPTWVYLQAVDEPPDMAKPFPRFYGRHAERLVNQHTGAVLTDLDGFSGAPILGFRRHHDGQVTYFLIAIQSGWRPDLHVVAGPLMPAIAKWIGSQIGSE
jgi:hypothetical protein